MQQWSLRANKTVASPITLGTEEMDETLSQPMNRWVFSPVARSDQIMAGKDSCGRSSRPPPAGSKTAAEGKVDLTVFVLPPRSKWHYDNCAVVFSAKLDCLKEETSCQHNYLAWKRKQVSGSTWDSMP